MKTAVRETFSSFGELNARPSQRCSALWGQLAHPEYREALEHELSSLIPVPTLFDGYVEELGRVSSTCWVSVDRNRYSVPCEWVGRMVISRARRTGDGADDGGESPADG